MDDERPLLLVVEDNADIRQYVQESLGEYYRRPWNRYPT